MRGDIIRLQRQSSPVLEFSFAPVPLYLFRGRQQNVCFGRLRIQLQCLTSRTDHFGAHHVGGSADEDCAEGVISLGKPNIRWCKCRVTFDRLLKIGDALFDFSFVVAALELELAFQIALIDFWHDVTSSNQQRSLLPRHRYFNSLRNRLRYLAFQSEDVAQLAIVSLRPEVFVRCATDQLCMDTDPTPIPNH